MPTTITTYNQSAINLAEAILNELILARCREIFDSDEGDVVAERGIHDAMYLLAAFDRSSHGTEARNMLAHMMAAVRAAGHHPSCPNAMRPIRPGDVLSGGVILSEEQAFGAAVPNLFGRATWGKA